MPNLNQTPDWEGAHQDLAFIRDTWHLALRVALNPDIERLEQPHVQTSEPTTTTTERDALRHLDALEHRRAARNAVDELLIAANHLRVVVDGVPCAHCRQDIPLAHLAVYRQQTPLHRGRCYETHSRAARRQTVRHNRRTETAGHSPMNVADTPPK